MELLSVGFNRGKLLCRDGDSQILLPADMIPDVDKIVCLSLGFCKGISVYDDGSVLVWGGAFSSRNPSKNDKPYKIKELSNIVSAKSGRIFDMFLDNEGKVFYLPKLSSTATKLEINEPIIGIFGYEKAFVIGKSGTLYQIQNVSQTFEKVDLSKEFVDFYKDSQYSDDKIQSVISIDQSTLVLTEERRIFGQGKIVSGPKFVEIKELSKKGIVKIDGMYDATAALSENGEVYVNGSNSFGQIGLGSLKQTNLGEFNKLEFPKGTKIIDIALGHSFSLFLDENGTVWSTGNGSSGSIMQGSKVSCSVPTKVSSIEQPVRNIYCGSCFSFVLIGDRPDSKSSNTKKRLSNNGLDSYLAFSNNDEFHFLFGNQCIDVNRLFADFISPKVAQFHFIDPTIDSLMVSDDEKLIDAFKILIQIFQGQSIEINKSEVHLFIKMSQILSNDELSESILKNIKNDLDMSNVFSISKIEINRFSQLSEQTKKFLAENFYEILKNYQKELFELNLNDDMMFDILSDSNLMIENEDSLYIFVLGIVSKEKNNFFLLECIEFQLLSEFYVNNFVSSLDAGDINGFLWMKLIKCLRPINPSYSKPNFYHRYKKRPKKVS